MAKLGRARHSEKQVDSRAVKALVVVILACLFFLAGFALRGNDFIMARFGLSNAPTDATSPAPTDAITSEVASRLGEVEQIVSTESLDSYDTDTTAETVINSFLTSTEDPYLRYYSSARYLTYVSTSNEGYPGVGVFFAEKDGQAYALDVFEGSSAAEAGVQAGDYVVAIDGDRTQAWSATEVINAVQREAGSSVVITWRRADYVVDETASTDSSSNTLDVASETGSGTSDNGEYTTTLECQDYEEPNVEIQLIDGVGYISLKQFTSSSDTLVRQAIDELTSQGAKSFVLDLRDNPGGYLTKAVDVASLFVSSGVVVQIETVSATTSKSVSGDVATDAPLVVLVNGNTSGAAEVLVAALRDYDRCTIVGATTMGRGSVQVTKTLSFGGALRYTVARYKSPSGYQIDGVGISPDVAVTLRENSDTDNQKDVAVETASSLVSE